MPIFNIQHITRYEYDRPVKESCNEIRIFPYSTPEQEVLQHDLNITGHPDVLVYSDYWGNKMGNFNLLPPHKELIIESKLIIRTTAASQTSFPAMATWEQLKEEMAGQIQLIELSLPIHIERQQEVEAIAAELKASSPNIITIIENCSKFIYREFKYKKGITSIETTVDEILKGRAGVCQDFAHLMLEILRTLHIPGRYVSGYICPNKNGMRGEGATHAWVEAYIPGYGWAGIDPTNNVWVTNTHVKLAVGKDFNDCSPVRGTFKGPARQKLSVYVAVGYEDGASFGEVNDVAMREEAEALESEELVGQQ